MVAETDRIAALSEAPDAQTRRRGEALERVLPSMADLPDHGNLRDDMLDVLRRLTSIINSPTGGALKCLLGESDREHPFVKLVHERVLMPRKRMFQEVLHRAIERGEARPDAIETLAAEVGPAMVAQRFLAEGPPVPDSYLVSDRKSTRLNSSHVRISYAVFC